MGLIPVPKYSAWTGRLTLFNYQVGSGETSNQKDPRHNVDQNGGPVCGAWNDIPTKSRDRGSSAEEVGVRAIEYSWYTLALAVRLQAGPLAGSVFTRAPLPYLPSYRPQAPHFRGVSGSRAKRIIHTIQALKR
jgi:hypothetical protein